VKNKFVLIAIAVLFLGGAFFAGIKMFKANEAEKLTSMAAEDIKRFVPDYAPTIGPVNPEVYLVEFFDPECESCRDFYPFVKMILEENPGKVQLVMRYAPFHPNSKFAIKILEAARKQGKYWEALEVLFRYQPEWGSHHHPQPELIWKYLPEAGVDIAKIKQDMNDPAIDKMIEQEIKDGEALGVRGTPHFFVNGKPLEVFGLEPLRDLVRKNLKN
jgi:protein-disulfide isomerase